MGRIDRLGSPNKKVFGINFWPSNNINTYLNLQGRIEKRMAAMKIVGAEVHLDFSDTFREIAENETLEQRQKARMLEQMQTSWEDIETGEQSFGFDVLSLENYRQELLDELRKNEQFYKSMPNGIYTGFKALAENCPVKGIIALLGYPSKANKTKTFEYKGYELVYINENGREILLNQKEVLNALAVHKDCPRDNEGLRLIDQGDSERAELYAKALKQWIKTQAAVEELQSDGTVKQKMGPAELDLLNKLKAGSRSDVEKLKNEGSIAQRYNVDNFDLITWFIVDKK
jgi:hypothetical protein